MGNLYKRIFYTFDDLRLMQHRKADDGVLYAHIDSKQFHHFVAGP